MTWMRCSACKSEIAFGALHWVCSVSTCNRHNTDYKFCTVACWDSHVGTMNHRDAWAVEAIAPTREEWQRQREVPARPAPVVARPAVSSPPSQASAGPPGSTVPVPSDQPAAPADLRTLPSELKLNPAEREILIVVSKMKKYVKERSGMNTSDAVAEVLSGHVRALCDEAIRTAAADGRKTVLDRDVPRPRRS